MMLGPFSVFPFTWVISLWKSGTGCKKKADYENLHFLYLNLYWRNVFKNCSKDS